MSLSRRSECPGPCNPRNRGCRRNCIQNVASILEELPPCIRMRLCEEDLFAVLAKNHEQATRTPNLQNVATTFDYATSDPTYQPTETSKIREVDATTKESCGNTDQEEKECETDKISMIVDKDTQTESVDEKPSVKIVEATDNIGMRALPPAEDFGIPRDTREYSASESPPSSQAASSSACRRVNATVYSAILLLLAVFAWNSPAYRIFLSSQICGILVVLSWRISGSVPF